MYSVVLRASGIGGLDTWVGRGEVLGAEGGGVSPPRRRRVDSERLSMQVDALEVRSTTSPTSRARRYSYGTRLIGEARH